MSSNNTRSDVMEFSRGTLYFIYFAIWFLIIGGNIVGLQLILGSESILFGLLFIGAACSVLYLEYTLETVVQKENGELVKNPANHLNPLTWENVERKSKKLEDFALGQGGGRVLIRITGNNVDTQVRKVSDNNDIYELNPDQFEQFVAFLWQRMGYNTEITQSSGDRGIDVLAEDNNEKLVLQAKRYAPENKVSRPTVQKSYAAGTAENADGVVVVTTSSFSKPAIREARTLSQDTEMMLIDGGDLDDLSSEYL